jgi:hypothetical protein
LFFLLSIATALSPALAQDNDVAAFFRDKTLRIVVGVGVGSGYDLNARLLARHLASHIPGTPGIIVQNQPGAGSLAMTNTLYNVSGDESTPKIHLAMESGEVQGTIANWSTLKAINADWIAQKKVRMLAQWALTPSPELAGIPMFIDVARTDAERAALKLMLARLEYGRPFFLPPNVPVARVEALRRAFDATMRDAAYLADAQRLKIDVDPLPGEEVAALVGQILRTPPDMVAKLRTALDQR